MSKPLSANDQAVKTLADDLWKEMLAHSPIWGTYLGIEVNDGALDDTSDAARLRDRAMWEKYSKAANAIGDDGLDIEWKITRDLISVGGSIAIAIIGLFVAGIGFVKLGVRAGSVAGGFLLFRQGLKLGKKAAK